MISFHNGSKNDEGYNNQASMAYAAQRATSKDSGPTNPFKEMKEN